ncbi:Modification methylase MjaI [Candidatus Gugararchaeum adminiculabundum]|nr:Modification methylase MjaI [Candidatus Gugararchaeum adminiculabundum]
MKNKIVIGDARNMRELEGESIQLVVTSPPYFNVKNYGKVDGNIGSINNYFEYLRAVERVFEECFRVLEPGRFACVNISDIISGGRKFPIPAHYVYLLERMGFDYRDDIIWKKPSGVGAGVCAGGAAKRFGVFIQHPYPMYYFPNNIYEHVLIFRKGKFDYKSVSDARKHRDKIDIETAKRYWNCDIWELVPEIKNQYTADTHPAMFPEKLPENLIRLFTYRGETVLDPFLGSGTTMKAAWGLGRRSVGYEINEAYLPLIKRKVGFSNKFFEVKKRGGFEWKNLAK